MTELPTGWSAVELGELGRWVGGGTPSKSVASYWNGDIPWVSPKDMKVERVADAEDHISQAALKGSATNLVPPGSVLVVTRSGILRHTLPVAVADRSLALNQDLKALVPGKGVDSAYVAWALRASADKILGECSKAGTTVANIETRRLLGFKIPLAPVAEQRRIVAAIEEQFSRLEAAQKDFRGVRSRLLLLRRVLRRAILTTSFPLRPLAEVVDVLDSKRVPINAKERAGRHGSVPYYGATAQVGWIDRPLFDEELVLLGEDGAPFLEPDKAKAYVISGPSWVNNHAHVLRPNTRLVTSAYLKHALDEVDFRSLVTGTTRLKLTQAAMRQIHISVPSVDIQERLVSELDAKFTAIQAVEIAVAGGGKRSGLLRNAVLDRALCGGLVLQDPNDEPASVLLERLAAERAAAPKARRRRPERTAA